MRFRQGKGLIFCCRSWNVRVIEMVEIVYHLLNGRRIVFWEINLSRFRFLIHCLSHLPIPLL